MRGSRVKVVRHNAVHDGFNEPGGFRFPIEVRGDVSDFFDVPFLSLTSLDYDESPKLGGEGIYQTVMRPVWRLSIVGSIVADNDALAVIVYIETPYPSYF